MATSAYATDLCGVDFNRTDTDPQFTLGQLAKGSDGSEWVYVQADASGVTGTGYVVLLNENWSADMLDTTNSASGFGQRVGVAPVAVSASEYFWTQVKGVCVVQVAASAAANTALNSTATAGQVDDDASVGAEVVNDLVLTTANGASAATAAAYLSYPTVGATL